jgi:3'-phosphoadenosine 5'-phosphosulfate sulfotransferase (PAPS reductase)/FAD synthetase
MSAQHFVSVSGGKDSTAVYLLALESGRPFRAVFADTGNEHPLTLEYVRQLADQVGGPEIEWVKADFSREFEIRRRDLVKHWSKPGRSKDGSPTPPVEPHLIERALKCLVPTGIPFLDLCMLKGRFPGAKSRFCTEDLKLRPMDAIKLPLLNAGTSVIEWIGERAEESQARASKPRIERIRWEINLDTGEKLSRPASRVLYRPIHHLKHGDVFAIAKRHGVKPNPLYLMGMGRVGCMPCIMVKKAELRAIASMFPEHIDRIEEWEEIVRRVSRRGNATFLAAKTVPGEGDTRAAIRSAVEWARTSRGGWNYDLEIEIQEADRRGASCNSAYGLCE